MLISQVTAVAESTVQRTLWWMLKSSKRKDSQLDLIFPRILQKRTTGTIMVTISRLFVTLDAIPISRHCNDVNYKVHMTTTTPNPSTPYTTKHTRSCHTKQEVTTIPQQQATN